MTAYYNEIDRGKMIAYLVTNLANGRQYVGITRRGLRRRWTDHIAAARNGTKTALHAAIRKYGAANFQAEHIASALTRDSLSTLEALLIQQYRTKAPHGYNLTDGGEGVIGLDPAVIARTADRNKGRKHSDEARRLIGAAGRGRQVTQQTRQAISAARKGCPLSPEHRAKLAAAKLGKTLPPRSEQHSARISEGLRLAHERKRRASK